MFQPHISDQDPREIVGLLAEVKQLKNGLAAIKKDLEQVKHLVHDHMKVVKQEADHYGTDKTIAFTASENTGGHRCYQNRSIIQFPSASLNVGEAFDPDTGKFVCPLSGYYHFYFAVMSTHGERVYVVLNTGGHAEAQDGQYPDMASTSMNVECAQGQEVYIYAMFDQCIFAVSKTTFSGYLIGALNNHK